jgi:CHAT domain-containing protein
MQRAQDPYSDWNEVQQDLTALRLRKAGPESPAWDTAVSDGFYQAGLGQGRALLQGIAEHRRGLRSAEATALRRSLAEARADRGALRAAVAESLRSGEDDVRVDELRERAADLAGRIDELVADLDRLAPRDAALDAPRGVRHQEVSSDILRAGEALLQYVAGEDRLYAYVVTPDDITWHDVGAKDELHAASRAHLDGMRDPDALAGPAAIAATGRPLHDLLLAPLLPDDLQRLIIVPTAELSELPFEALVIEADENPASFQEMTFLVDRLEVAYGASTSVLSLLTRTGPREAPGRMLILGDPRYGRELADAGGDAALRPRSPVLPRDFVRLPGTRDEALGIARVIEQGAEVADTRDVSLTTERFTLRLGTAATPSQLKEGGRDYSVIHCAAHGYVHPEDARLSGIALTPDEQDDGYLSVAEILELDLDADLAVLSACETGRGEVLPGEGVQSVARAFAYAGARSVIASLWQVDDRETAETMTAFYARYLPGDLPASASLRAARLATRHGQSAPGAYLGTGRGKRVDVARPPRPESRPELAGHPYFWAPFIYIGLPR